MDGLTFTQLQDKMRTILSLMGDLNEMEKTISRLKDELAEEYKKLDKTLDGE